MYIFGTSLVHDVLVIFSVLLFAIIANFLSIRLSKKFNLIDYPNDSGLKIQKKPTPLSGGFAILLSMAIFYLVRLIFIGPDQIHIGYLGLSLLAVVIVGMFDDRLILSAKIRLFFYITLAALIYFLFGSLNLGLIWMIPLIFIFAPGIITAVNMIDGMDGLCISLVIISLIAFAAIGVIENNQALVVLSVAGITAGTGFLLFNFHPARVFLGSSGSELLGYLLFAVILISMEGKFWYFFPMRILVVGIPIFDLIRVMIIRKKNGKPLMTGDRNHIYDRLLDMHYGQRKVWVLMVAVQLVIVILVFAMNNLLK